ncbi:MAG: DUF4838 domain-containing protein [Ruminococcaceae bacterium]|nr:DUF4838 domain-containing protein [Oscillospiraceae bacterium]
MFLTREAELCVVIPSKSNPRERFAAEELKKYIRIMLGADAKIVPDTILPCANAFLIGGPKRNSHSAKWITADEFSAMVSGPEGMLIKSFGNNTILLAGSSSEKHNDYDRGTVYAVYEFLERFCECSFAAFSNPRANAGEIVPSKDILNLENIHYCKPCSDRQYRTAIVQYSNWAGNPERELNIPFFDWLAKNRYNRILTWASIYEYYKKSGLLKEAERRGIRFSVGHHESSPLFLPPYGNEYFSERYYETHPEYYKLKDDGSRFCFDDHAGQWAFCSRNEDAIAEVANNIIIWLGKNPDVDVVALWPNDGMSEQCCCTDCSKYSKTENYCYFINSVAKLVKKVRPDVMFDMLIYVDLWECPDGVQLEDNIIIDESTWHSSGLRTFGKPDGSCLGGTHFEDNLLLWKAAGARVVYYDYYMGVYGLRQRLIPMADEIQSIWQNFAAKGIDGAGTQIECFNIWNHLFNFFSFARTGYNTALSMEDNLLSVSKLFGKGGEKIAEIIRMLEACINGQTTMHKCGHYLMEHIDKEAIYQLYEEALSMAENARFRNNIKLHRMVFRYTDVETKEELSGVENEEFFLVEERYADETGELAKMTEFDSFWKNDPGYGIMIPVKSSKTNYAYDKWYDFE